jgi:hypothetical protein
MALPNAPSWDTDESCMWFEIAFKAHTVLCRIDGSTFRTSLGTASSSEGVCRASLRAQWSRIHAAAFSQAEAGHFESQPSLMRRFVWLTDKSFAPRPATFATTGA